MLNWIVIWVGTYLFGIGGPFQTRVSNAVPRRRTSRRAKLSALLGRSAAPGPPHRVLRRDLRARRLLADAQPHDARIRGSRRRPQSRCRAVRWHQRRPELLPGHGDRRPRSPGSPAPSTSSAGSSGSTSRRSRARRSASSVLPSRCSVGTPPSASASSALLFAALQTGTASRNLDPSLLPAGPRLEPGDHHPGPHRPVRRRGPDRAPPAPSRAAQEAPERSRVSRLPDTRRTARLGSEWGSGSWRRSSHYLRSRSGRLSLRSSSACSRSRSGSDRGCGESVGWARTASPPGWSGSDRRARDPVEHRAPRGRRRVGRAARRDASLCDAAGVRGVRRPLLGALAAS